MLSGKLTTVKGSDLVADRTSDHRQLELNLSSSFLCNLENVTIQNIADLSDKVIFRIDESQDLTIPAEDSLVSFLSIFFGFEVVRVRNTFSGGQRSAVDDTPSFVKYRQLQFRAQGSDKFKAFLDEVVNRPIDFKRKFGVLFEEMSESVLWQTLEQSVYCFESEWKENDLPLFLNTHHYFLSQPLQIPLQFASSGKQPQHFLSIVANINDLDSFEISFLLALEQSSFLVSTVDLAIIKFLLDDLQNSHFYLFDKEGLIHVSDVSAGLVEGAFDVSADEILEVGSGRYALSNLKSLDGELK
jgi:hypothetical protein